ncbi:hypothetical protein ABPG74_017618 [Tetrahymena malaccensis]
MSSSNQPIIKNLHQQKKINKNIAYFNKNNNNNNNTILNNLNQQKQQQEQINASLVSITNSFKLYIYTNQYCKYNKTYFLQQNTITPPKQIISILINLYLKQKIQFILLKLKQPIDTITFGISLSNQTLLIFSNQ